MRPHRRPSTRWLNFLVLVVCLAAATWSGAKEPVDFNRDIRPILANRCFTCHGPDEAAREAELRLDGREYALSELDSGEGHAIVPGDPLASLLLDRVSTDDEDLRMPPPDVGPKLTAPEIDLLTRWIEDGAKYERHWSLQPVTAPSLRDLPTAATPIDRFVLAKLREVALSPNARADRYSRIRRVSLTLTGLPPTIDAVDRFVGDHRPDSYERLVDRLLASPRFGERWARPWLDIARYADSAGYAQDPERTIWRYRDWVIDAYNTNKPFDQFTIEQLAGDLLSQPTNDQLLATAFHRNTMTNSEGGTDDEEFRSAAVVDRVNTTMQVWMGLTMACAQCHDHKYDEISQAEYFRFYAILNNTADADRGDESPWLEELNEEQLARKAAIQRQLKALQESHSACGAGEEEDDQNEGRLKSLQEQLASIRGTRTPIMRELTGDGRRETFVHVRGNFRVKSEQVSPGVPASLHEIDTEPNRLDLAHWLVAAENPLTARVLVNRYWEHVFGRGLVATSEDFGMQGDLPSHPKLLDYLASELMRHEWDTKWLLKQLVLSDAFQRASTVTPAMAMADQENRWLARGPRFRLPAEMIRDQALAASGLLSTKLHGPSVRPPRPKLGLRSAFGGSTDWETSAGEDQYRRGLYTSWRRTTPYPSMSTFDAPSREFCTVRRIRTNTPLQALVTLNDPVYVEAARALAERTLSTTPELPDRLQYAFRSVLARPATQAELQRLEVLLQDALARYTNDSAAAKQLTGVAESADAAEHAAWTTLCNVILNLDETLAPR